MHPDDVIAIMRHKGWLKKEPQNTRTRVTSAVRYMMISRSMSVIALADALPRTSVTYIRRKISEYRWLMDDLDHLAEILGYTAADYASGYRRMAELDEAHQELTEESQNHG